MRPAVLTVIAIALAAGASSCNREPVVEEKVYRLGARAQAGPLIYTALSAEWREDAVERAGAGRRLLVVRMSVTNSGAVTLPIPTLELVDRAGKTYAEITDAKDVPEWLGAIRMVEPAQTEHGSIAFDAPPGDYRLRVLHRSEPDPPASALIDLPYQSTPAPRTGP